MYSQLCLGVYESVVTGNETSGPAKLRGESTNQYATALP